MIGALVALFVASLTNTIIGIALPTIAGDLGGQDKLAIVASAALLTMTVSTPLWGKTSDMRIECDCVTTLPQPSLREWRTGY
jgi:MFS family permease